MLRFEGEGKEGEMLALRVTAATASLKEGQEPEVLVGLVLG